MKILVFTEKPFAPAAVKAIADVINASGNEMMLVEKALAQTFLKQLRLLKGLSCVAILSMPR